MLVTIIAGNHVIKATLYDSKDMPKFQTIPEAFIETSFRNVVYQTLIKGGFRYNEF